MKRAYEKPEIEIRNYKLPLGNVVMTSDSQGNGSGGTDPDLNDGDDFDLV